MLSENHIYKELRFLVRLLKVLNLIPQKVTGSERRFRTAWNYCIAFLMLSVNLAAHVANEKRLIAYDKNHLLLSTVMFFYLNAMSLKSCAFAITITVQRGNVTKLWKSVFNLDRLCTLLEMKPQTCGNWGFVIPAVPYILHTVVGLVHIFFCNAERIHWSQIFFYLSILIVRTFEVGMKMKTLAILTLFANYYKQMDAVIRSSANEKPQHRVIVMNYVGRIHQDLADMVQLMNKISAIQAVAQFEESFVLSVGHIYNLVSSFWFNETFFQPYGSLIVFLDAMFNILIFIVPIGCCVAQENKLRDSLLEVSSREKSEIVYRHIKNLSLQLSYDRLEFTAGGVFPLDYTMFFNVISALSTYLVILIQFRQIYN